MLVPVIGLLTLLGIVLALFWWSYRTIRTLLRRGDTKWGRLVYNYGVRGFGACTAVLIIACAAYLGGTVLATSDDDSLACAIAGAIFGAIFGIPVGLGLGYFWGTQMAFFIGIEPDPVQTQGRTVGMPSRKVLSALLAPILLLLFFVATFPSNARLTIAALLFLYALAHLCFWPPVIAAQFVGRRLQLRSQLQFAALVGGFSLVLAFAFATPLVYLHFDSNYGWKAVGRDGLCEAGAAVGAYILYRAIAGREPQNERPEI